MQELLKGKISLAVAWISGIAVGFLIALHKFDPAPIGTVHSHMIRQGRA
jgi:hypothetical protein